MRLIEKEARKDDPDPKALSCYALFVPELEQTWQRFVDGRPVSAITTRFLEWSWRRLEEMGKEALLLIWDNASSWHKSKSVGRWGSVLTTARSRAVGAECAHSGALLFAQEERARGSTP